MALGVIPLAATDVLELDDFARPWVRDALAGRDAPVIVDWRAPPFEAIVALEPDLILYVNAPGDRQTWETLSKIAPTVAAPVGSADTFGVAWRDQLRMIALALGRRLDGEDIVAGVEGDVTQSRDSHPELRGLTVIGGLARPDQLYFWPERDPRMGLMTELGLRPSPSLSKLDDTGYLLAVSPERYDLLTCDILYLSVLDQDGQIADSASGGGALRGVDAVRRGQVVYAPGPAWYGSATVDGDYAAAFALGGALGIPACLDRLVADLSEAAASG